MRWMSGGVECTSTLGEFAALLGVPMEPFHHSTHVRIHGEERLLMSGKSGLRHCYPPNSGSQVIPKVKYFTDFWYVTHTILRHTIHVKYGEKGMARGWMVNLLNKIGQAKVVGKKLDVMDYMWNEMKLTVHCNKVPIYGSYLQTLIDSQVPALLAKNYLSVIL